MFNEYSYLVFGGRNIDSAVVGAAPLIVVCENQKKVTKVVSRTWKEKKI